MRTADGTIWAMEPNALNEILQTAAAQSKTPDPEAIAKSGRPKGIRGSVAVLPLLGTMSQRPSLWTFLGGTSMQEFGQVFDALAGEPSVGAIVMDVDSGGGQLFGMQELWSKVYQARGTKPIIAVANAFMASGAYYIATAADEIVITPSGMVGNVGTLAYHYDRTGEAEQAGVKVTPIYQGKYKTELNEYVPLTDEAREEMQRIVDGYYSQFVGAVAKGRGVTKAVVESHFGQGRMLLAADAVAAGMADRVATLDETIGRLVARKTKRGPSADMLRRRLQLERERQAN